MTRFMAWMALWAFVGLIVWSLAIPDPSTGGNVVDRRDLIESGNVTLADFSDAGRDSLRFPKSLADTLGPFPVYLFAPRAGGTGIDVDYYSDAGGVYFHPDNDNRYAGHFVVPGGIGNRTKVKIRFGYYATTTTADPDTAEMQFKVAVRDTSQDRNDSDGFVGWYETIDNSVAHGAFYSETPEFTLSSTYADPRAFGLWIYFNREGDEAADDYAGGIVWFAGEAIIY